MGAHAGPADWWTEGTDAGREHVATKGIVQSGLVINLDAGVNASYPRSGTTWSDLSGNGYNGVFSSVPVYSTDDKGKITFDGVDDYIAGVNNADVNITGNVTVECWFRVTSNPGDWVRILGKGDSTNRTYGLWYNVNSTSFLYQRYGTTNMNANYTSSITLNKWYHMVGTSNSSTHVLYIDGTSVATSGSGTTFYSSTQEYRLGYAGVHTYHHGDISVGRLYNRALTIEEIQQNFNATRNRFGV